MLVTTRGYLIQRQDYQDFDEIITLINEHGLKFTCYCLGTRKITSKNARNLDYGNFCEFIFFYSNNHHSKLKKVTTLSFLDNKFKQGYVLATINDYYYQIEINTKKYFDLYQNIILFLLKDINEYLILLYGCLNIMKLAGLSLSLDHCQLCNHKNNLNYINLNYHGLICSFCSNKTENNLKINPSYLKLIANLIDDSINLSLININDYDVKILRKICLQLMHFLYDNLSLYANYMKEI